MPFMKPKFQREKNKYLITGTSSGLGKYLHDHLGGASFNRGATNEEPAEIIIHCAFNRMRDVNSQNLYTYISDNIFLTKRLTKVPHKKFIYISTIDVYPQNTKKHVEEEIINLNEVSHIYGFTKLISESVIQNLCQNVLILRCSTLLGKDSKENSLIKIIKEDHPSLTLSADSVLNYISHKHVLEFIKIATEKDLQGIYNLASSENILLSQAADLLNKKVKFGDFIYNVGNINNTKATMYLPVFKKTSKEVVSEFLCQEPSSKGLIH